jgi:hypothetical protein
MRTLRSELERLEAEEQELEGKKPTKAAATKTKAPPKASKNKTIKKIDRVRLFFHFECVSFSRKNLMTMNLTVNSAKKNTALLM